MVVGEGFDSIIVTVPGCPDPRAKDPINEELSTSTSEADISKSFDGPAPILSVAICDPLLTTIGPLVRMSTPGPAPPLSLPLLPNMVDVSVTRWPPRMTPVPAGTKGAAVPGGVPGGKATIMLLT